MREKYPDSGLTQGTAITYDDIAKITGCKIRSNRWKTITNRWRRLVQNDSHIIIGCRNQCFVVLDDVEKTTLSCDMLNQAVRKTKKSVKVACLVDRKALTEDDKKRLDTVTNRQRSLLAASQIKGKLELPEMV